MAGVADMAKLKREIDVLEQIVSTALRANMQDGERRALRAEIEIVMQRMDELRNRLGG